MGKPRIPSAPEFIGTRDDAYTEFKMTKRNALADALQSCRDLRNQLNEVVFPLQKRIRELEVERDAEARRTAIAVQESETYRQAVVGLVALLHHLLRAR